MDQITISQLLATLSELFINLSAGWFGAAFIVVPIISRKLKLDRILLTYNFVNGILALILSFVFKLL